MKKIFKILFFVFLSIFVIAVSLITVSAINAMNMNDSAVGIIGGADGPTAIFITRTLIFDNPLVIIAIISLTVAVISAIIWGINRKK